MQSIRKELKAAGLAPASLEIEITENILIQSTHEAVHVLRQLQEMGIRIALDDFGTGYSSLNYLTSFQVDTLRIDRSFVMGCSENQNNLIIIKTIIAMGHSLGMKIVAEGVETSKELFLIKNVEADKVQGYYFSPPVPAQEF